MIEVGLVPGPFNPDRGWRTTQWPGIRTPPEPAVVRYPVDETLTQAVSGILGAGLALQAAVSLPPVALRQAVEHVLDLLDDTVKQAQDDAFAGQDALRPDAVPRIGVGAGARTLRAPSGPLMVVAGGATASRSDMLAELAAKARSQAETLRVQARAIVAQSADTKENVAATFGRLAEKYPAHAAHLRALSDAVGTEAARIRSGAHDHAVG